MRRILAVFPMLFLSGCASVQSTFFAKGPAAESIAKLSWFMTILFLAVTLIMWVLLVVAFKRRRGSLLEHAPIDIGGGQAWIAIGGLAVPLMVLTVIFILGLRLLAAFPIHGMHGGMPTSVQAGMEEHAIHPDIRIIGHQWWWEVQYLSEDPNASPDQQFTTANEIHIPVHRAVNIELDSADVMHSFWVPSLHGKVDMIPGHPNFIRIEASQSGDFKGQCAEFCGAQHAHMRLLVVAQEPEQYQAWLATQRADGVVPTSADAIQGEQVFLAGPCSMCHQVRGTLAGGHVAPDLTHFGSRQYLAANSFPNNDAYLEAWVTHAQSLKPEAQMPDLAQFSGEQLRELVAYLRQLR